MIGRLPKRMEDSVMAKMPRHMDIRTVGEGNKLYAVVRMKWWGWPAVNIVL